MRILFLLMICMPGFAQLPSTGNLSIKNTAGSGRSIAQAVDGNTTGNKSLTSLSVTAGKVAPHSMLEFRGYSSVQAPGLPRNVTATEIYGEGIYVYWDSPIGGGAVDYYYVYFTVNGGSELPLGVQSSPYLHQHSELSSGSTFQYYIYAVNAGGWSPAGVSNSVLYP